VIRVGDVARIIERAAPPVLALPDDNPGLQVGRAADPVSRILVALDPTPVAVRRAIAAKADLLVTHHPLFMDPLRRIDTGTANGAAAAAALGAGLAVYAAHTNLDAAPQGLAVEAARLLGLDGARFLHPVAGPARVKVVVFTPAAAVGRLHAAMSAAGAGWGRCGFMLADFCPRIAPGSRGTARRGMPPRPGRAGQRSRLPRTAQASHVESMRGAEARYAEPQRAAARSGAG
jgi:putative NIF3 family GTP cyclohydrolase 1 type 2